MPRKETCIFIYDKRGNLIEGFCPKRKKMGTIHSVARMYQRKGRVGRMEICRTIQTRTGRRRTRCKAYKSGKPLRKWK